MQGCKWNMFYGMDTCQVGGWNKRQYKQWGVLEGVAGWLPVCRHPGVSMHANLPVLGSLLASC